MYIYICISTYTPEGPVIVPLWNYGPATMSGMVFGTSFHTGTLAGPSGYIYIYMHTHIYIYIYATRPPKDLPKSMPSETFLATFIPTVQIMMTQTGGGHVKTCTYPGFTQMFQTGQ